MGFTPDRQLIVLLRKCQELARKLALERVRVSDLGMIMRELRFRQCGNGPAATLRYLSICLGGFQRPRLAGVRTLLGEYWHQDGQWRGAHQGVRLARVRYAPDRPKSAARGNVPGERQRATSLTSIEAIVA